jgi:hypothetical protein
MATGVHPVEVSPDWLLRRAQAALPLLAGGQGKRESIVVGS